MTATATGNPAVDRINAEIDKIRAKQGPLLDAAEQESPGQAQDHYFAEFDKLEAQVTTLKVERTAAGGSPHGGTVYRPTPTLSLDMSPGMKQRIAIHEAGHAVVAVDRGSRVSYVTIIPNAEGDLGHLSHKAGGIVGEDLAAISYAGMVAVEAFGFPVLEGMDDGDYAHLDQLPEGILAAGKAKARRIVANNRLAVAEVARQLLAVGTLTGEQVKAIVWSF